MKKEWLNNLYIGISALALLLATKFLFGIHWGWIDDIYVFNTIEGVFFKEATNGLFIRFYTLLSSAFIFLSELLPFVNVVGLFMQLCVWMVIFLIIRSVYSLLDKNGFSVFFSVGFVLVFYVVFILEFVYMQTFTSIAIALYGLAMLYVIFEGRLKLTMAFIAILAMLIRAEVLIVLFPLLLVFILCRAKVDWRALVFLVFTSLLSSFIIQKALSTNETEDFLKYSPIIGHILDAGHANNYEQMMVKDSARTFALFSWFQGDMEVLLNEEYVLKLEMYPVLSPKWVKALGGKLNEEYNKMRYRYSDAYTPSRNWFWKGIVSLLAVLLLSSYFLVKQEDKRRMWGTLMGVLFLFASIFGIAVLYKMEYRVFYPTLLVAILGILQMNGNLASKKFIYGVLIFLSVLAPLRFIEYQNSQEHLSQEKAEKEAFREEVNSRFDNKLILFDLFTSSLYSPSVVGKQPFNEGNNTFLYYGEVYSNFLVSHQDYLREICGSERILPFYECLYDRRESVVFAFIDFRVRMYEMYFEDIYGVSVRFKKIDNKENALNSIKYSYSWVPLNMDYYVFDDSFEDYNRAE